MLEKRRISLAGYVELATITIGVIIEFFILLFPF